MKVAASAGRLEDSRSEAWVLPFFEKEERPLTGASDLGGALSRALRRVRTSGGFTGKKDQVLVHHTATDALPHRVVLAGLGPKASFGLEALRRLGAHAARATADAKGSLALSLDGLPEVFRGTAGAAQAVTEGALLASYRFGKYRPPEKKRDGSRLVLVGRGSRGLVLARAGVRTGIVVADATGLARDLANLPGNDGTPAALASAARAAARTAGLSCRVLDRAAMRRLGMGALLSVARGSAEPPCLIRLEHGRRVRGRKTVCLVGKGVTFDSGGISLKPGLDMHKMKYDKSGGCAVIGALVAAARLRLPVHVIGLVPASENLPSGEATRPGDVIRAMNGKTIEVWNTDAEGRLLLADALSYAQRSKPDFTVDIATLTGSCAATFAHHYSGIMGNTPDLLRKLEEAGTRSGERLWELPIGPEYQEMMKGECADLKNIGGPKAGASTAGAFLAHFAGDRPWAHVDIAGTAYDDPERPYARGKGATGVGVRLFVEFLRGLVEDKG